MQHGDIWRGIDLLARNHGLSTSGLAKLAGLDATAFNKSKRLPKDGRPRWPSTESISRALDAVGADFNEFAGLVSGCHSVALPLFRTSDAALTAFFASADPGQDTDLEQVRIPDDEAAESWFVLEIDRDNIRSSYANGDRLIVSRSAPVHLQDLVLIKPRQSSMVAGRLFAQTATKLTMQLERHAEKLTEFARSDLEWMGRILWVSA